MTVVPGVTQTLDDVTRTLTEDRARDVGVSIAMARLMLAIGNLTPEAREYARNFLATTTAYGY